MPSHIVSHLSRLLRAIYFIRFALLLWIFPLLMVALDHTSAASITRGILTPESPFQAISAAFMLFSTGAVALLLVRLVAINGYERFPCELSRNDWFHNHFGKRALPWWLFLSSQAPGIFTCVHVTSNMGRESSVTYGILWLVTGIVVAIVFWIFAGLIFLWSYVPGDYASPGAGPSDPRPTPVALLFPIQAPPGGLIREIVDSDPPPLARWLKPLFLAFARRAGAGYSSGGGNLYEGHRFAAVSLFGLLTLYIFLFAFTAPVLLPLADIVCYGFTFLVLAIAFVGLVKSPWPTNRRMVLLKGICSSAMLALLTALALLALTHLCKPRAFAVFASVLVLAIAIFWGLATVAFLLDRSRAPIFTGTLVLLLLLKGCPYYTAEHYFAAIQQRTPLSAAPMPADILQQELAQQRGIQHPLIIVTAEGGGIHSALWTATVLMALEEQFQKEGRGQSFHNSLMLASGVSGGSLGLLAFLREYTAKDPKGNNTAFSPQDLEIIRRRVLAEAGCSSLQAVAWGLTYYDFLNFVSPIPLPSLSPSVSAVGDKPDGEDRSWALERAFDRNLSDPDCLRGMSNPDGTNNSSALVLSRIDDAYQMTLGTSADLLAQGKLPAFTFNTTAVETGGRFLLSDYELPSQPPVLQTLPKQTDLIPAASFIGVFGHSGGPPQCPCGRKTYADLPLATAVRLSGTFPYVSSASRIPADIAPGGFHFVDGGYFDNDGTSSVAEFLYFALLSPHASSGANSDAVPQGRQVAQRIPILLIEIRDDLDLNASGIPESFANQQGGDQNSAGTKAGSAYTWGPDHQFAAPIQGFWNAGHNSDTRRNRRELCMVEQAYSSRIDVHHVILDYRSQSDKDQPLSWDLTPRQKNDIRCALDPKAPGCAAAAGGKAGEGSGTVREQISSAINWFSDGFKLPYPAGEVCDSFGEHR